MSCVLLLSSDASTEAIAQRALAAGGYEVITAPGSDAAIRSLFSARVDAAVVDGVIGEEGVREFCDWLRSSGDRPPVVFLASAGARWMSGLLPVDAARDEIVAKPCRGSEIRTAVEKVLDAAAGARPEVMMLGDLTLDRNSHELRGDGAAVQLTSTEFRLMHYLAQRRGTIVSAEELLEKVWEFFPGTGSSELVRSHVRNLRSKIRLVAGGAELVQTVPRRGYRLV